jgi:hypothetical protein
LPSAVAPGLTEIRLEYVGLAESLTELRVLTDGVGDAAVVLVSFFLGSSALLLVAAASTSEPHNKGTIRRIVRVFIEIS